MRWWIDEILEEVYCKRKRPVSANDIPKINEALEEVSSLIKRGWTQWAGFGSGGTGARSKNDHNIDDLDDYTTLDQVNWDDPRAVCWCLEGAMLLAAKKKGLTEEPGQSHYKWPCDKSLARYLWSHPALSRLVWMPALVVLSCWSRLSAMWRITAIFSGPCPRRMRD